MTPPVWRSVATCGLIVLLTVFKIGVGRGATPRASSQPDYVSALAGLHFRSVGPATQGGRLDSIAVLAQNPDTYYVGAATGGLWKTTNGGTTFEAVFDNLPALAVGAVAVAPSNPSIVWVGSGEANNRQSSSWGSGVYKSDDAGRTWKHMGLNDTQAIGRIAIDPTHPNVAYVAAVGHLWGPNAERGLFKTSDGGGTWTKALFIDNDTGVVDVAIDPRSPNVIYAAAYERRRTPWGFDGGGLGSAIYKSSDAGETWKKLAHGLPATGNLGRIGLAIYAGNPDIVYTVIEGSGGGVFRSEDQGEAWKQVSRNGAGSAYFSKIRVDPNNDLRVWVLTDTLQASTDGGKTFTADMRMDAHWDFHDLWIDPRNSKHILAATDGGLYWSADSGKTWDYINNLPLGQVYRFGYDFQTPYHLCGGFQDNGVLCGPSRNRSAEGIANSDWKRVLTGDGFYALIDPFDPNIIFTESQDGNVVRHNLKTHEWFPIRPEPNPDDPPYRFGWESPLLISSHDPHTLYFGANFLFRSKDQGNAWVKLGGDLTTAVDRNKLKILDKLPTAQTVSLNYGVAWYPAILAIAESPLDANVLWVGTQDGNVQVSRDGGGTWINVAEKVPDLPRGTWVSSLVASRTATGTAYLACDGHRSDDLHAYVFRTTDFGQSWKPITNGLAPQGDTVHVIQEDPAAPNLLFAGTEQGAYVSFDFGANWSKLQMGLPSVPVDDIAIHPREHDLILGTHGRSFYILDDIRPLEELNPDVLDSDLHIFNSRPAVAWRLVVDSNGYNGDRYFTAPNPPYGALITYYLKQEPAKDAKVKVTIRDHAGEVVQEFDIVGHAGINRISWDLRYATPAKPNDIQVWAMQQGFFLYRSLPNLGMPGPWVEPGDYPVQVKAAERTVTTKVGVEDDPNVAISPADRQSHHRGEMEAFRLYARGIQTQKSITALDATLTSTIEAWKKNDKQIPEDVRKAADTLAKDVDGVRTQLLGPKERDPLADTHPSLITQIATLLYSLEAHTASPTRVQEEKLKEFDEVLSQVEKRLAKLMTGDLPDLNDKIRKAGVPYIVVPGPTQPEQSGNHGK
jgi:photosystem II stability/assembly factor-like uncharacterized protein